MKCVSCKEPTTICVKNIFFCFCCFERKIIKKVRQRINQIAQNKETDKHKLQKNERNNITIQDEEIDKQRKCKVLVHVSCTKNSFIMLHILNKIFEHWNRYEIVVMVDKNDMYTKEKNIPVSNDMRESKKNNNNIDQYEEIRKYINETTANITKTIIYTNANNEDTIHNTSDYDAVVTSLSINETSVKALTIFIQGNGNEACNFVNDKKECRIFECITDYELDVYYNHYKNKIPSNIHKHGNTIENETKRFVDELTLTNYSTSYNIIETLKKIGK
ncbi:hypothetical protein BDAP_000345 [Binucleata daphniae]